MRQTAIWLSRVKSHLGDGVEIAWRCFALEQVNSKLGPEWKAWEQGGDYESRGLAALRAGIAARRQGDEAHWRFMLDILEVKHAARRDIRQRDTISEVAQRAGLDMASFERDFDDPDSLGRIGRDHEQAVELGAFGTPTFVFPDGDTVFLKMYTPPEAETLPAFNHFLGMARHRSYFGELKRPQPPWPRGALT